MAQSSPTFCELHTRIERNRQFAFTWWGSGPCRDAGAGLANWRQRRTTHKRNGMYKLEIKGNWNVIEGKLTDDDLRSSARNAVVRGES
jgi:hypothetical protein